MWRYPVVVSSVKTDPALSTVERQSGREHCFKERPAVVSRGNSLEIALFQEFWVWGNMIVYPDSVFDYNRHVNSIRQYIYIYIRIHIYHISQWLSEHNVWFGRWGAFWWEGRAQDAHRKDSLCTKFRINSCSLEILHNRWEILKSEHAKLALHFDTIYIYIYCLCCL